MPVAYHHRRKHVLCKKHIAAAALRKHLVPEAPKELIYGSAEWLTVRMTQWREHRAKVLGKRRRAQ